MMIVFPEQRLKATFSFQKRVGQFSLIEQPSTTINYLCVDILKRGKKLFSLRRNVQIYYRLHAHCSRELSSLSTQKFYSIIPSYLDILVATDQSNNLESYSHQNKRSTSNVS